MDNYNLCIVKPNKSGYSETFIQEHINKLAGHKKVVYGGAFPVYNHLDQFLISSKLDLLSYLFQKRILKRLRIKVRDMAFVRYLKKEKIAAVFAEYGFTGAMVTEACKQAKIPLIMHFHGGDAHHKQTVSDYLPLYKEAFAYASGIVAVSLDMVETLVKLGAPREKISFISCGVDINAFKPVKISEAKNFISVGRFVEKKSPLSIIKAFKKLIDVHPDAKLWMVGNGPLFNTASKLISDLGLDDKIQLTGAITQQEIRKLLANSRCFIQHSVTAPDGDMEGTPVAILEAAASGLPIVSTRHAGIKQAVLDGVSGYLVGEFEIEKMAEKMVEVAAASTDKLTLMGAEARKHIAENYFIEGQISKLNNIILQSINNTPA